ncbi:MAG: hypothetical protein ACI9FD_003105 [Gammaproteobacteria bacterium]|jgi:hypothetical protein
MNLDDLIRKTQCLQKQSIEISSQLILLFTINYQDNKTTPFPDTAITNRDVFYPGHLSELSLGIVNYGFSIR